MSRMTKEMAGALEFIAYLIFAWLIAVLFAMTAVAIFVAVVLAISFLA